MAEIAVDVTVIERVLLSEQSVEDCAVRVREVAGGAPEFVAYVVTRGAFSEERLQNFLDERLPREARPDAYVLLSALPLDEAGEIDERALASFQITDADLVRRWEMQLNAVPGVQRAAVIVEEKTEQTGVLHLLDLLAENKIIVEATLPSAPPEEIEQRELEPAEPIKRLAISSGATLRRELPKTLAHALRDAAAQEPSRGIVYIENDVETSQSYRELVVEAERILAGFRRMRLEPGDKVIFQFDRNRDFVPAFWACTLGGFVAVPISIAPTYKELNATVTKLYHTWQMLDHPLILTTGRLSESIASLPALLQSGEISVATIEDLRASIPDKEWHDGGPEDVALMLLTSGSTGTPKGVMLTNENILGRSAGVAQLDNHSSADISFNWFPLDHVGGIVMFHTLAVYLRAQQLLAPTEMILQEPLKWLDIVDQHRVTITWAPNFAFGLINDRAEEIETRKWDLSSLRFILNGGEAIVAKTSRRFLELLESHGLPVTAMHPAWGMSETSSGITSSHQFGRASSSEEMSFVEVGGPIPGASLRIVDSQDNIVEEGKVGRLQVKGITITSGYYRNEELNREAFSHDGWFNTGDLGILEHGFLTITGRTKDVIIINGANFHSHEIESVVEETKGVRVSFTAATAVRDRGIDTDRLAIFFSPLEDANLGNLIGEIRTHVLNRIGVNPDHIIPVEEAVIPKTAIGKIQRQQLRDRFEAGEFQEQLKQLDIEVANANTLPDWFYRKSWSRREESITDSGLLNGGYLVFADNLGLGASLRGKMSETCSAWISVYPGSDFAKLSPNSYRINPADAEHYRRLLTAVAQDGAEIHNILHLWHYTEYAGEAESPVAIDKAQTTGLYSLLHTIQALAATQEASSKCRLFVVGSHTQPIEPGDIVAPEKATVLGLLKTLPLELSWLDARHIDLEPDESEANARRVQRELAVYKTRMEVAYRGGRRMVGALAKVNLIEQQIQNAPIKESGLYLITGGLGGLGTELAQFLIRKYSAKLILVGTTSLPAREDWPKHLQQKTEIAGRISSLLAIERTGGQVKYHDVDVADLDGMEKTVADAEKRFGQGLAGVFHLAGEGNLQQHWKVMEDHWVVKETPQTFEWMFRPKVHGTWVLNRLLKDRPEALLVLFSSINSLFGGATFSAYAAANSFLDCFGVHRSHGSHSLTYCFNWTMWDDIGMSRGNPTYASEISRKMGYFVISKEQALNSLVAGLLRREPQLVVGLDRSSIHAQRYIEHDSRSRRSVTAYFTPQTKTGAGVTLPDFEVRDRFGTLSTCEFNKVAEIALDENGQIDFDRLSGAQRMAKKTLREVVAPRTDLEREIANIWRDVLRIPQISIHDNFFEMGGQSLLATQIISRIRKTLNFDMPLRALFETSTVARLSVSIEQSRHSLPEFSTSKIVAVSREAYRAKRGSLDGHKQKRKVN